MISKNIINIVKGAILNEKNELLIVKRANSVKYNPGGIVFPGGNVEEGETLIDALKREIKEEVGLEVKVGQIFREKSFEGKEPNTIIKITNFLCFTKKSSKIILQKAELEEFQWLCLDDIAENLSESMVKSIGLIKTFI